MFTTWVSRVELLHGVAKGMAYLHSNGVFHLDIKTANILLSEEGLPKVCNFHTSKHMERHETWGTPAYMAPELMASGMHISDGDISSGADKYDRALADVYSFGVVIFAMLSRSEPYASYLKGSPTSLLVGLRDLVLNGVRPDTIDEGRVRSASTVTLFSCAPAGAVMLMKQCWDTEPTKRPSGFDEIAAVLGELVAVMNEHDSGIGSGPTAAISRTSPNVHADHQSVGGDESYVRAGLVREESDRFSQQNPMQERGRSLLEKSQSSRSIPDEGPDALHCLSWDTFDKPSETELTTNNPLYAQSQSPDAYL
jgi:serine/threonine protein kinase